MTDLTCTSRHAALAALATLTLAWPASAFAQTPPPTPSPAAAAAAERAQRDAERVFEFIKFHTLRPKTIEPSRPARPPAPAPAAAPAHTASTHAAPAPAPAPTAAAERASTPPATATAPSIEPPARPATTLPAVDLPPTLQAAPITTPAPVALPAMPEALPPAAAPAPDADDDDDDTALQLQNFVAPVLPTAVQATLGAGSRAVKVRFTVEVDGRVSQAEAAANVPRRLAKPAVDAILQWRFAPLPQPRTVDVEIAFRRD
jgi:hypothetical protein